MFYFSFCALISQSKLPSNKMIIDYKNKLLSYHEKLLHLLPAVAIQLLKVDQVNRPVYYLKSYFSWVFYLELYKTII